MEPSVGVAPTTSSIPGTCSDSLSYKGVHRGLAGTTRTCDPRLRRAVLSSTELRRDGASTAGLEPALTGFVDQGPLQLDDVDVVLLRATDRIRTDDLLLDRQLLSPLSYGGRVRALGLEPSVVRGKGPVPYQSGVTRMVGRGGIEPPLSDDGWSTASCAPWRDRPMGTGMATGPQTMPL